MKNKIKCPYCKKEFEATDALKHQIEEQVSASIQKKHHLEIEKAKQETEEQISKKLSGDVESEKQRNKKLSSQLDELLDETRKLRQIDQDRELQMKTKLLEEEKKIREEVKKNTDEEHKLKNFEKDKKLSDALDQIEILKTKIQQGSQQTQGESLELEIETKLKSEFPSDKIIEVKKGQRGADVMQEVIDKLGRKCGTILWESKNAKWTDRWINKLKEDQRRAKADLAVLVSVNLPSGIDYYNYRNGVWICSWKIFSELAYSLRFGLISIYHEKQIGIGVDEKMKVLYQYLTGNEFKHRIEGIVESFTTLQTELEKEKRYFNTKWARQEKEIRKVIDHTHGMYGDLQGVIGKSLPEIKSLELEEGEAV